MPQHYHLHGEKATLEMPLLLAGLSNSPFCRLRRLGEEEGARIRSCIPQMRGLALRQRASRPLQSPFGENWKALLLFELNLYNNQAA